MKYSEFEKIISKARMSRYYAATSDNSKKAMTLYRLNLGLSQELFTVISCFEITLRNAINSQLIASLGDNWLKEGASSGGIFDNSRCK